VRICDFRTFTAHSGNRGVNFTVIDKDGKTCKTSGFMFVDASLPHLAKFAKACGLTREQAATYDPAGEQSHRILMNKPLRVYVDKDPKNDKYHIVTDYEPRQGVQGSSVPVAPVEPVPFDPEPTLAPEDDETPF